MMLRGAIIACALAGSAQAQSVKLDGHEITVLLTGNTAVGDWDGISYRQYFDPDGTTTFAQNDARSALGNWRVSDGAYQSIWSGDPDWQGWFIMEYAGDYYWVSKTTPPTPFHVLDGQQLVEQ